MIKKLRRCTNLTVSSKLSIKGDIKIQEAEEPQRILKTK
jgi:hypothetical protein